VTGDNATTAGKPQDWGGGHRGMTGDEGGFSFRAVPVGFMNERTSMIVVPFDRMGFKGRV
jgi:hypothetical protein